MLKQGGDSRNLCFTYNPQAVMKVSYNCVFVPEGKHFLCYNRASFFGWIAFLVWFPKLKLQKRPVYAVN